VTTPSASATLTDQQRQGFNSVSAYFCPTRRGKVEAYGNGLAAGDANTQGGIYGPQSDYAFIYSNATYTWPWDTRLGGGILSGHNGGNPLPKSGYVGPFRVGRLGVTGDLSTWEVADSMSHWKDGSSNQLLIGEKFIPKSYLSRCEVPASTATRSVVTDCSIFTALALNYYSSGRSFYAHFAKNSSDDTSDITNYTTANGKQWGGIHPGVCNFLVGDGSVHAISNTVPTGNGSLLYYLGHVNDGNAVSIP
jgi:hypothetical protein